MLAGFASVSDRVTLGGNAGVQQFCRIGRLAMVAGNEGVARDLPPFCMVHHLRHVSSLNLVGLRRAGYRDHIPNLKRAFELLYERGMATPNAAAHIETKLADDALCLELARFVRASERGIVPYISSRELR
jgi:UDP-N-acetylglucosamine acyltransferase